MKKHWMLLSVGIFILLLTACGQGTTANENGQEVDSTATEEPSVLEESTVDIEGEGEELDSESIEVATEDDTAVDVELDSETEQTEEETALESTTTVTLIFSDNNVMDMYLEDREILATDDELYKATLEAWIEGPTHEGLTSLISSNVDVQSVEIIGGVAHVSFSNTLLDTQVGSGTEYMLLQQIAMSMKQFGFDETQILIDGEVHPELFGHIDTSVPVVAEPLENYQTFN